MSGLMWPIEAMSPFLQILSNFVPMTHAIRALKIVMVGGLGIQSILFEVFALSVFAVIMLALGISLFRKEIITRI